MFLKPGDSILFEIVEFIAISTDSYDDERRRRLSATVDNCGSGTSEYYDQYAIQFDTFNCDWAANITLTNRNISDNDNNNEDTHSCLLSFLNTNTNQNDNSLIVMENITIVTSSDILSAIENTNVNNSDGREKMNQFYFKNIDISDCSGSFLYHWYPNEPTNAFVSENINYNNNVQEDAIGTVLDGQSLIIVKEDGSGCNQLPSQTTNYENDGLHLTLLNNVLNSNNYNDSLIEGYCSYIKIKNGQFLNNIGNLASEIHIDSSQ